MEPSAPAAAERPGRDAWRIANADAEIVFCSWRMPHRRNFPAQPGGSCPLSGKGCRQLGEGPMQTGL